VGFLVGIPVYLLSLLRIMVSTRSWFQSPSRT
jgi:hypothetical protein